MDEETKKCACGADCAGQANCPECGQACAAATEAGAGIGDEAEVSTSSEEEAI